MVHEGVGVEGPQRVLLVCCARRDGCQSLTYDASCFNAFSRVDVRVDVKIPGGVHAYVVDLRGERCAAITSVQLVLVRAH